MDVHHHSHTSRKKWTHYFWEFLMLFLAVTLGFFVENQREHYIEHQREKQYAKTLYEDIKQDTTVIKYYIFEISFATSRIDTFRNLVQQFKVQDLPGGTWYYYGRFATRNFKVTFQDATLQQLKNSGGLRYFKKASVANAIARYDQVCRNLQTDLLQAAMVYDELLQWRNRLFNAYYLDEIMEFTISASKVDSFKKSNPPLFSEKKEDFIHYANLCQLRAYNNRYTLNYLQDVLKKAEALIEIIKKEYHFQ